jgi:hypothetical protein
VAAGQERNQDAERVEDGEMRRIDWSAVDWSQRDIDIAEQLGLSRERIRQCRKTRGAADPEFKHRGDKFIAAVQWVRSHPGEFPATAGQWSEFTGVALKWHSSWRRVLKFCGVQKDWGLPTISTPEQLEAVLDKSSACWRMTVGTDSVACPHPAYKREYCRRLTYRILVRPLTDGERLVPLCRDTRCVNPGHMKVFASWSEEMRFVRGRGKQEAVA